MSGDAPAERMSLVAGIASRLRRLPDWSGGDAELRRRVIAGAAWSLVGAVIARGSTLVAGIAAARILGKTGFGEYGMIQNTVGMLGIFAGLGLGLTATRYVAEWREAQKERAASVLVLSSRVALLAGTVISLALVLGAEPLAVHALAQPELAPGLRLSAGLVFLGSIQGAQTGALSGLEAFRAVARVNLLTGMITFPAIVAGAWFGGLEGAVIGNVAALGGQCLLNRRALAEACADHGIVTAGRRGRDEAGVLLRFALPAFLSTVISMPVLWGSSVLLVNQPGGYEEMAVLSAAYQWRNLLLFIPTVMGQFITPIVAERLGKGSRDSAGGALLVAVAVSGITAVPAAIVLGLGSPWIMAAYGEGFAGGWRVLVLVLATSALMAVQNPVGSIIAAAGRMWIGAAMNLAWAMVMLVATLALVRHGALGVAGAYLIAYCAHGAWTVWFARRLLDRGPVPLD